MRAFFRGSCAIALGLALLGSPVGGLFGLHAALAQGAAPGGTPARASGSAAAGSSASASAAPDASYYAYATQYYLQYLSNRGRPETSKDPYHFFNYYQFYRERYAAEKKPQSPVSSWLATMPFRSPRTQAFARFIQVASSSAFPTDRWAQPPKAVPQAAGK